MVEFDLMTLVFDGSLVYTVGDGVGYASGAGAEVAGKALSSASRHFFLCSFSCFGILTSFFLHCGSGTSLHSYDFHYSICNMRHNFLAITALAIKTLTLIYLELDVLAFVCNLWLATGGVLNFTGHSGDHLGFFYIDVVIIRNITFLVACDFGNFKVNLLGDQFAFSPCNGFACFVSSPDLFAIFIGLPFGDAVLFGNISAFWHHFGMFYNIHAGFANLF